MENLLDYLCKKQFKMTTIVIKPKNKAEKVFLTRLLKKMNIETHLVEEPTPNYETQKAIIAVESRQGTKVKDSKELFSNLGI
jgi:transcriptional antiterminator